MYNSKIQIQYTNNQEYRQQLRVLFNMKNQSQDLDLGIDAETLDENDFDTDAASNMMDYVFDMTENEPVFQELYDYAAALMFSQDREIGIAVLFSYDYLAYFHPCICDFTNNNQSITSANENVAALKRKIKPN